jgi:hypothetical protein
MPGLPLLLSLAKNLTSHQRAVNTAAAYAETCSNECVVVKQQELFLQGSIHPRTAHACDYLTQKVL